MSFRHSNKQFSPEELDLDGVGSLRSEDSETLFRKLPSFKPTLEIALREAKIQDYDIVLSNSMEFSCDALEDPKISSLGLTPDEAGAITCYTLELGDNSPYITINGGLVGPRNRASLSSTRKLIFLLLSGLRKLPRFKPSAGQMYYRGIKAKVPQNIQEANGHQYYAEGNTVTWWGFTSTTTNPKAINGFIKGSPESTVFNIGGENLWGYDIQKFSQFPKEGEILLEPEVKVLVNSVIPYSSPLMIHLTFQPFDHLVLEDIIPVSNIATPMEINQTPYSTNITSVSQGDRCNVTFSGGTFSRADFNIPFNNSLTNDNTFQKSVNSGSLSFNNSSSSEVAKKWDCAWKECPKYVYENKKYSVDKNNSRIATKVGDDYIRYSTIIGNTPIPLNEVTSWNIKILKSKHNVGGGILIGIALFDINQNEDNNYNMYGWYFDCYSSSLWSEPPHNYKGKNYGLRKEYGGYVRTGDSVGVMMDMSKGELSFVLNGVNLGVAYEGIPLDKPLVPCVILYYKGDSVELDTSFEVKENVDVSVLVPSNITTKSLTWDSITLTWDAVDGTEFYQVEIDGNKSWIASTTNTFTKRGLLPETEYIFRVRVVKWNRASGWSAVVKGRTQKETFEDSGWKECPVNVDWERKYSVDENNPRIATKISNNYIFCTIIGNTHIPLNRVISWNIKILKSKGNIGGGILVGVAPFDIDQNKNNTDYSDKCGWYFDCYDSILLSGPPHYYDKQYGPRREKGKYVHAGDSVSVMMDTSKGDLLFILNGVNYGVAYEGIPLDKPLVPCVILYYKGDSVELDTLFEVKENVDVSVLVPSNVSIKSTTWDSITLTWDIIEEVNFYQIEVDRSKMWYTTTTNSFTRNGLLPEIEHSFRVRTVKDNKVSEWSNAVKGRTIKAPDFSECVWKECPDCVDDERKYSVDENNHRIVTTIGDDDFCTIIGNTHILLNKVTLWSIKILKSRDNDGRGILAGVAPFDIDQNKNNTDYNDKCGWYFDCYDSTLFSGPPHNYDDKEYGPRKRLGEYVHTGDSVGVVIDTARGELSFVLNRVNLGVAYEGVPLDKPLVPSVVLYYRGDSVELDIREVKENEVDNSIPALSDIWDHINSITPTQVRVKNALVNQIKRDEYKAYHTIITKKKLPSSNKYSFSVLVVSAFILLLSFAIFVLLKLSIKEKSLNLLSNL